MKFVVYMFIFCLFTGTLYSQDEYLKAPLVDILESLEKQHDVMFSYKVEDIQEHSNVVMREGEDLETILKVLNKITKLSFEQVEGNYIIVKNEKYDKIKLCGYIRDKATGEPLPFANIIIENSTSGTTSDDEGYFEMTTPKSQSHQVRISYIGYEDKRLTIPEVSTSTCPTIPLIIDEQMTPFLIIKDYITDGVVLTDNGSETVMKPNKIGNLPGQVEPNVLSSVQFLPGVTSPSSRASDIYIRGGTPDQNLILWEDIPIYHSAHYFGMISAIDPYIVKEMNIYRGGFGAEYGGRVSGVIDIKTLDETTPKNFLGVGSNMTHSYLNGIRKWGDEKKSSLTFSLRRSFTELGETPTFSSIAKVNQQGFIVDPREIQSFAKDINMLNDFRFLDTHLKFSSQITPKDKIVLSGLYTNNYFNGDLKHDKRKESQSDNMVVHNMGARAQWSHQWNDRTATTIKGIGTAYDYEYDFMYNDINRDRPDTKGLKENKIVDRQASLTTEHKFTAGQEVEWGYHLTHYDIDYKVEEDIDRSRNDIKDQGMSSSYLHSVFGSYRNPITKKLGLNLGLRTSYYGITQDIYFEPRVRVAYKLSDRFNVSAHYGKHYQFVGQVSDFRGSQSSLDLPIWALAEKQSIPFQEADHYQVGALYQQDGFVLDVQVYAKQIDGLSSRAYDFEMMPTGTPQMGSADIKGIDILVKKRFRSLRSWISYSYNVADLFFPGLQSTSFPSDYNQEHVIQWSNQWSWQGFQFSLGAQYATGLPYSVMNDIRTGTPGDNEFNYTAIFTGVNQARLPSTSEINFSVDYTYSPIDARWKAYLSFGVTNLMNATNVFDRSYYITTLGGRDPNIATLDKYNLGFTPNMSLRFVW